MEPPGDDDEYDDGDDDDDDDDDDDEKSTQDSSFLYMLFPYVVGGELFSYLRRFNHHQSDQF